MVHVLNGGRSAIGNRAQTGKNQPIQTTLRRGYSHRVGFCGGAARIGVFAFVFASQVMILGGQLSQYVFQTQCTGCAYYIEGAV